MIDLKRPRLSVVRQCALLQLNRSSVYYRPVPESEGNLELVRLIDARFLETLYYGSRRMTMRVTRLPTHFTAWPMTPVSISRVACRLIGPRTSIRR